MEVTSNLPEKFQRKSSSSYLKKLLSTKKITFKGSSSVEGVYDFNIEGFPELKRALKINTERKIQAQKEFEKEDAKIVKQLEDILS